MTLKPGQVCSTYDCYYNDNDDNILFYKSIVLILFSIYFLKDVFGILNVN